MKHLLLIITLLAGTITNASVTKPLPWDITPKTFKQYSPITEVIVFKDGGVSPYGYISVTVKRPFTYNICEYTTIQVWVKTKYSFGFPPHRTTEYIWNWMSFSITIPAGKDIGYSTYMLQEGEDVDVNTYMSPGYLDPCY